MAFLSSPLTFFLVYLWSRRNPHIRMNFLGVFTFQAAFLPWVLLSFTFLVSNVAPIGDLVGMAIGHIYYFFEDVYPGLGKTEAERERRRHILGAPQWLKALVGPRPIVENDASIPVPEEQPLPNVEDNVNYEDIAGPSEESNIDRQDAEDDSVRETLRRRYTHEPAQE